MTERPRPDRAGDPTGKPALWTGRGRLQRVLAGAVGGLLGGLVALVLPVFLLPVPFWVRLVPVLICATAGYLFGDRAIHRIIRLLGAT